MYELDGSFQSHPRDLRIPGANRLRFERSGSGITYSAYEIFCDLACDQFERLTMSPWRPRSGSLVSRSTLTASMIDSRDFLNARRKAETELLVPVGPRSRSRVALITRTIT